MKTKKAKTGVLNLTESDWMEIYYAVEYKRTSTVVRYAPDACWWNQFNHILECIGPDGQDAYKTLSTLR